MAALAAAAEAAGFPGAVTVGNTGNLIASSPMPETDTRERLQAVVDKFGIKSEVFIRPAEELAALVEANPFPEGAADHPSSVGVCFFHDAPSWPEIDLYDGPEAVALVGRHLVIDYRVPRGSRLNVEKQLGQSMTQRNWRVVANLAAKAAAYTPRRR